MTESTANLDSLCCVSDKAKKILCRTLIATFRTYLFACWANPVVHILLLKSSIVITCGQVTKKTIGVLFR